MTNSPLTPSSLDELIGRLETEYHAVSLGAASDAAKALRDLSAALEQIVAVECVPFGGGLDYGAIDACADCQRYKDHPIQRGICDTHRKPIWDRERHDDNQQRGLIYHAKDIARQALTGAKTNG